VFLEIFGPLKIAFSLLVKFWWVYMPILLFFAALESWLAYVRQKYLLSIKWVLLEIKPPPDVEKSPKIVENIFAGLHGAYIRPIPWRNKFFKGEVQNWFSFEIVGNGGEINFYVRTPEKLRDLVEAQFFAQYPDAEISIVDDYIDLLPPYLPNNDYDLFGAELIFAKEDAYPIKTYPFFEEESGRGEFKRTDPLAPLAETLSTLEPGEHIWLQLLVRGTGKEWVDEAQTVVAKLTGKEPKAERNILDKLVDFLGGFLLGEATTEGKKEEKQEFSTMKLTPGQRFVLEQVENKIAKLGFKAGCRFLYIARKELFRSSRIAAVTGMFKQFYFHNLNSFKLNPDTITAAGGWLGWLFPSRRGFLADRQEFHRKWQIYQSYRKRSFVRKVMILNTEELATLFHLPGVGVKAPAFPRVEAKKGQPPAGLPTR
jgi:hypothetical protein